MATRGRKPSTQTLRKREAATASASRGPVTVIVQDCRFGPDKAPHYHENVPANWTRAEIMSRYGIAEHLHVAVRDVDGTHVINQGRETP